MTSVAGKLAGRFVIAVLLVMLAAGSVLAVASALPGTAAPVSALPPDAGVMAAGRSPDGRPERGATSEARESPASEAAEQADETPEAPSQANLARIVERLAAAGITTTVEELRALVAKVGVGGAVRALRFAHASGKTTAEILALFEAGKGWGEIVRELELKIGPGNGSIMGRGHGRDEASRAADRAARAEAKAARAAERAVRAAERAARAAERARQGAGSGN